MTTLNDIKAAITNYNLETLEFIEYLEKAIDYLKDARNKVEDLIG